MPAKRHKFYKTNFKGEKMNRVLNFSAGPSGLPLSVLERARDEFLDYHGLGFNIMEVSHRGKVYETMHNEIIANIKGLYNLDDDYAVLFLQGGGHMQFAQVPLNLYIGGEAQYANTGVWTKKAIKDAGILGINYRITASSEDSNFDHIPSDAGFSSDADYCYICSNNTIYGTQYKNLPNTHGAPLVVDSSSDLFSREIDFKAKHIGVFWGGAQKNAGPAGVSVVIIRKDLLDRVEYNEENTPAPMRHKAPFASHVPTILRYKVQAEANSLANTPPTYSIYLLGLVIEWIKEQGGLKAINAINEQKAELLYKAIDESSFFKAHARADSRSLMNVSFTSPSPELDALFVKEAENEGMIGLKGHRLLGGLRASIYNAVSLENVKTLVSFMSEFERKNG